MALIHLLVQLVEDVVQTLQVGPGLIQALLRFRAAQLVARDASCLLQQEAAVLGLAAQDEVDLALLDEAVGAGTHARVEQQVLDILEPGLPAVDAVFAARVAVESAGDGHLPGRAGQGRIGHLQDELDLG